MIWESRESVLAPACQREAAKLNTQSLRIARTLRLGPQSLRARMGSKGPRGQRIVVLHRLLTTII
jgi:hypothetical protein